MTAGPHDFDLDSVTLRCLLPSFHTILPIVQAPTYVHSLSLKIPQFCCSGKTALGKIPSVLLYLLQVKPFLFLFFALVVSFGSIYQQANRVLGNTATYRKADKHVRAVKTSLNHEVILHT